MTADLHVATACRNSNLQSSFLSLEFIPRIRDRQAVWRATIIKRPEPSCSVGDHGTRSDSAGARTQDLAIKSRMLYQLSYGIPSSKV